MLRRVASVGLTSGVIAMLAIVAASVLGHRLGPTGMGEYQSVIRWASIWLVVGMFGFAHASSYFASRADDARIRVLVGNSIRTTIAQSAILLVGGYCIAPFLFRTPSSVLGARIFLLYLPINLLITNFAHIAIGHLDTRVFNTYRLVQAVAFVSIVVPLVLVTPTSVAALVATVLAAAAALVYLVFALYKRNQLQFGGDTALWKSTAAFGVKAYPGVVGRDLNLYVDQLLIYLLLPTQFLGLYAAAVSAASVVSVASTTFFYLAQPETQNSPHSTIAESSARMSRITIAFLVPLAGALSLVMPFAVPLVYGPAFASAVTASQILCFAGALDGVVLALAGVALGSGRPVLSTVAQVGGVVVKATLVLVLLSRLGITGAAVASLTASAACAGFLVVALARPFGMNPARFLIPDKGDLVLMFGALQRLWTPRTIPPDPAQTTKRT